MARRFTVPGIGHERADDIERLVQERLVDAYPLGRADTQVHLAELDRVLEGVNGSHRGAVGRLDDLDLVRPDLLIGQLGELEKLRWFVRAHISDADGTLPEAAGG